MFGSSEVADLFACFFFPVDTPSSGKADRQMAVWHEFAMATPREGTKSMLFAPSAGILGNSVRCSVLLRAFSPAPCFFFF